MNEWDEYEESKDTPFTVLLVCLALFTIAIGTSFLVAHS